MSFAVWSLAGLRDAPQVLVQSDRCLDLPLLHGVRASTHEFGGDMAQPVIDEVKEKRLY